MDLVPRTGSIDNYRSDPGYRITLLTSPAIDEAEHLRGQPSRLLADAHRFVPFQGRADELRGLQHWRDGPARYDVLLVHGVGGQGKTRLAREFARRSLRHGWAALEGGTDHVPGPVADQLAAGPRGRIVLIDYAERWPARALRLALADARLHEVPTRILVLARPAGDWWRPIRRYLQEKFGVTGGALALQPLAAGSGLFASARDSFAAVLGISGVRDLRPPPGWSGGATALEIQMAALAAVFAVQRDERLPDGPGGLSAYLLDREYDHWDEMHRSAGLSTRPQTMARAVWLACLAGPLQHREATALVTATGLATGGEEAARLLDDHRMAYPAGVLAPLIPDRMAEDYIALRAVGHRDAEADPWTEGRLAEVLTAVDRPDALTTAISVAERSAPFAHDHLGALLRAKPALVLAAGVPVLNALAGLTTLDAATLAALEAEMPLDGEPELMDPLATLTGRLYRKLRSSRELVPLGYRLARRLVSAHRYAAAEEPIERTVEGAANYAEHGRALVCHAEVLAGMGRTIEALARSERALQAWKLTSGFDVDQAINRDVHARLLHTLGDFDRAADHQHESTALWRRLAAKDAVHLVRGARSLTAEATYLRLAQRQRHAARISREAAALWERLDGAAPDDRHRRDLLNAWIDLTFFRNAPLNVRLASGERAARLLEQLWTQDITLLPRAIDAQRAYALALSDARSDADALDRMSRARAMCDWLVERDPGRHRVLRGCVLLDHAHCRVMARTELDVAASDAEAAEELFAILDDEQRVTGAARLRQECATLRRPAPATNGTRRYVSCLICRGTGEELRATDYAGPSCQACTGKGRLPLT